MGMDAKTAILEQKTALGIEFGSTRIKAVLIGVDNHAVSGSTVFISVALSEAADRSGRYAAKRAAAPAT